MMGLHVFRFVFLVDLIMLCVMHGTYIGIFNILRKKFYSTGEVKDREEEL